MDIGVVVVEFQSALKCRNGQLQLTRLRQHAAQVGASLDVVLVQLDGHIVPLSRRRDIVQAVQQLGEQKTDLGRRATGRQRRAIHLGRSVQLPLVFESGCALAQLVG